MSDKPVMERLQVKRERTFAIVGAPESLDSLTPTRGLGADAADVVLVFAADRAAMEQALPVLLAQMKTSAILWLAYPKLTSPLAGDLNRNLIHAAAPAYGLDTVSQIAIDADWSAMRLKRV